MAKQRQHNIHNIPVELIYSGDKQSGYTLKIVVDGGAENAPAPIIHRRLTGAQLAARLTQLGAPKADILTAGLGLPL